LRETWRALGRHRDRVHDRVDVVESATQRLRSADIGSPDFHARAAVRQLALRPRSLADDGADLMPPSESSEEVPSNEPVRTGHGDAHRLALLLLRACSNTWRARVKPAAK